MPTLFGVDIAAEVASAMGSELLEAVLRRPTSLRSEDNPTAFSVEGGDAPSPERWECRGMMETGQSRSRDGAIVSGETALVLGGTLPNGVEPQAEDELFIEGHWWKVIEMIERDPAGATYRLRVRR